jgi:MoxR-like ATPase
MNTPARFEGSENYVATHDLKLAVNAALTLQRPLLIKGEPGTGSRCCAKDATFAMAYQIDHQSPTRSL